MEIGDLEKIISSDDVERLVKIDVHLNSSWTEKAVEHGSYRCLNYLLTEQHVELSQYAFLRAAERGDKTLFTLHGFKLDIEEMLYNLLEASFRCNKFEMFKYLVSSYIVGRYVSRSIVDNVVSLVLNDKFSALRNDDYLSVLVEAKIVKSRLLLYRLDLMRNMYIGRNLLRLAIMRDVRIPLDDTSNNRFVKSFFLTKEMKAKHKKTLKYYNHYGIQFRSKLPRVKR
jgi:hypothetical protein